jgi:hypothetical protein
MNRKDRGWRGMHREEPLVAIWWLWLPLLLVAGLLNGGSTVAAFVVIGLTIAFLWWSTSGDAR